MTEKSQGTPEVKYSIEKPYVADEVTGKGRVALVAIHGMGQQLPFETIDDALEGLYGPQTNERVLSVAAAFVATRSGSAHTIQDALEPRVRFKVTEAGVKDENEAKASGRSAEVDVYEVHWSDFTSKATSPLETYWFLVASAFSGVAFKVTGDKFTKPYVRWVDGAASLPEIPWWHVLMLCLAMLDILALGAIGTVFLAVVAYRAGAIVLALNDIEWLLAFMQSLVNLFFAIEGVSGFFLLAAAFIEKQRPHRAASRGENPSDSGTRAPRWYVRWVATFFGWIFFLGPLVTLLTVVGIAIRARGFPGGFLIGWPVVEIVVWGLGFGLFLVVQHFMTEFVGDVVIYMSAHRVSRFHVIRDCIRQRAERTLRSVLDMRYDRVVVAAHSLGTVIAYDTLNALFLAQLAATGRCDAQRVHFVTYGSPLRKRAFLMRKFGSESRIRSALLGAAQPIVAFASNNGSAYKLASWTNVWSKQDWISGELTPDTFGFARTGESGPYQNVRETDLAVPLISHLNYTNGREVPKAILDAIFQKPGRRGSADA